MKVNLENELRSKKKASQQDTDEIINTVKLLMDNNAIEERNALTFAGLDAHVVKAETAKGVELERQSFEEEYSGKVFTREEIMKVCMKYDLRFLQARRYAGSIDQNVAIKLAQFRRENNGMGNNESRNFFIMAPASAFNLDDMPEKPKIPKGDPLLFYQINENNYLYLHKWGIDFTLFRRVMGFMYKSVFSMLATLWSVWFFALMIIRGLSGFQVTLDGGDVLGICGIFAIAAALSPLTALAIFFDGEDWSDRMTKNIWNSPMRRSRFKIKS